MEIWTPILDSKHLRAKNFSFIEINDGLAYEVET